MLSENGPRPTSPPPSCERACTPSMRTSTAVVRFPPRFNPLAAVGASVTRSVKLRFTVGSVRISPLPILVLAPSRSLRAPVVSSAVTTTASSSDADAASAKSTRMRSPWSSW